MKKLSILLLAIFYIGIANINAQTDDVTTENITSTEEVKEKCPFTKNAEGELVCVKTGKICNSTCPKKATKTCCKGKKSKSSCSKSKNNGFNYGTKKYSYGKKKTSSCSSSKALLEEVVTEEAVTEEETSSEE